MNNIILCGFMGCGKTTVGKQLAHRLHREYIDLDTEIQKEAGMSIPEIFAVQGEEVFRELEHTAVKGLSRRIDCVVSTGGGAMTFPRNAAAIDPRDLLLFLDAPFEVCYARIRDSDRPIVRSSSLESLQALFDTRRSAYLAAGVQIPAGMVSPLVVDAILQLPNLF